MKQEMGSILQLLLPLTQELSSPGRSEVVDQQKDLQAMLHQLKGAAQTLAQGSSPQVSASHAEWESGTGEEMQNKGLTLFGGIKGADWTLRLGIHKEKKGFAYMKM